MSKRHTENYVVVDIETTGFSPHNDQIIEIGALKVSSGEVIDSFQSLCEISGEVPAFIEELTGITGREIREKGKPIETVLHDLLVFIEKFPLVAHNSAFDLGFLQAALLRCGLPTINNRCIDTLGLARRYLPNVQNHKLTTLAAHLGIKGEVAHGSIADCVTTRQLYEHLLGMMG